MTNNFVNNPEPESTETGKNNVVEREKQVAVTTIDVPTESVSPSQTERNSAKLEQPQPEIKEFSAHSQLIIERGNSVGTIFSLTVEESLIGRWDADNGIFPDIDLDAFDPEAKVSRKHARIIWENERFFIEDLGSTNGTFINRGRRLLPGTRQILNDGDEIIVGKTFLRFQKFK